MKRITASALSVAVSLASAVATGDERAPAPPPTRVPVDQQPPATVAVSCDFIEIWATSGKGGVDSALPKGLANKLARIKQWTEYKQISITPKQLTKNKSETLKLAKGSANVMFVELVDKSKVRIQVDFQSAKGSASSKLLVDAGDWLSTAVEQPKGDGHLLAWSCK